MFDFAVSLVYVEQCIRDGDVNEGVYVVSSGCGCVNRVFFVFSVVLCFRVVVASVSCLVVRARG